MTANNSANKPILTNGQLWVGSTGNNPVPYNITSSGGSLTFTSGAGTLNADVFIPLAISKGGTGFFTIATHRILGGGNASTLAAFLLGTTGRVLIGSTGAAPIQAALTAGSNITVTNVGGIPRIATTLNWLNIPWTVETTNFNLVAGNGYITNGATMLSATLPLSSNIGDQFIITNMNNNGFQITQNAGQSIQYGNLTTTVGVTGFIQTTSIGDTTLVICTISNTEFQILTSVGELLVN
jgi:hypothetical protein